MDKNIKKDREELLSIIKSLDENSRALLYASAQVLKARQDMEKTEKTAG